MRKIFAFSAITIGVGALLYAGIGYWAVPHYSRLLLESTVSQKIGRTVTLDSVDFNPWTWTYELHGLKIQSRRGDAPFLTLGLLRIDASAETIVRLAPVVSELSIEGLHVIATINEKNKAELEGLAAGKGESAEAGASTGSLPAFAIYNIALRDASLTVIDPMHGIEERLTDIELALPFISTMTAEGESLVTPKLSLKWNDTPIVAEGSTKPFGSTLEAQMRLKVNQLNVAPLARLIPDVLGSDAELASAKFSADTEIRFRNSSGGDPASIQITGKAGLSDISVLTGKDKKKTSAAKLDFAEVTLKGLNPTSRTVDVDRIVVKGLKLDAERTADRVGLVGAIPTTDDAKPDTNTASETSGTVAQNEPNWRWHLGLLSIEDASVSLLDRTTSPNAKLKLTSASLAVENLDSQEGSGDFSFSGEVLKSAVKASGKISLAPLGASISLDAPKLALDALNPYIRTAMGIDLTGNVSAKINANATAEAVRLSGNMGAAQIRLMRGKELVAALRDAKVDLSEVDTSKRIANINRIQITGADVRATLTKNGLNLTERQTNGNLTKKGSAESVTSDSNTPSWAWAIGSAELVQSRFTFRDETINPKGEIALENISVTAKSLSSQTGHKSVLDIGCGFSGGTLHAAGNFCLTPLSLNLETEGTQLNLASIDSLLRGYAGVGTKAGKLALNGKLAYIDEIPSWTGDINLTGLDLVNQKGTSLMSWKRASLSGLDVAGGEPPQIIVRRAEVESIGEKQTESVKKVLGIAGIFAQLAGKEGASEKIAKAENTLGGTITLENIRWVNGRFSAEGISAQSLAGVLLSKLSDAAGGKWLTPKKTPPTVHSDGITSETP